MNRLSLIILQILSRLFPQHLHRPAPEPFANVPVSGDARGAPAPVPADSGRQQGPLRNTSALMQGFIAAKRLVCHILLGPPLALSSRRQQAAEECCHGICRHQDKPPFPLDLSMRLHNLRILGARHTNTAFKLKAAQILVKIEHLKA